MKNHIRILAIGLLSVACISLATAAGRQRADASDLGHGPETPFRRGAPATEAAGGNGNGESPCRSIARIARMACRNDARDDYLTQLANCLNLSDPAEAIECEDEAVEAREEELTLCRERLDARLDVCDSLDEHRYDPEIDPADFVSAEEIAADPNPYFPLVPGNTWVYENEEEITTVTVTGDTIEIQGVICAVVRDVVALKEDGETIEDTLDWYAEDIEGNLWYFGEIALNFEDGRLTDIDGSWIAGEEFGKAGILIPADPYPGLVYRQEFLLREAEDMGRVIGVNASAAVDGFDCQGQCLQTFDYTPIEPETAEFKFYLPGLGRILEVDLESGERNELVQFYNQPVD